MGKRELLIIAAFVALGVIVYEVTARPATAPPRRFSLATLLDAIRRGKAARPLATATHDGTIAVSDALTEILVSNVAAVTLVGEARANVSYTLAVDSNGPDPAAAQALAARAALETHDTGSALTLRATFAPNARQMARLTLHVPLRVTARIEGLPNAMKVSMAHVAAAELDGVVGDADLEDIAGDVSGTHRNGDLTIARAGGVRLTTVASDLRLSAIAGPVTLVARNGRVRIDGAHGAIDLDETNLDVEIHGAADAVRVNGTGGGVSIDAPKQPVHVDVRRAAVDARIDGAAPVTALTTDARLHVVVSPAASFAIDATATDGGTIQADGVGLAPQVTGTDARLVHTFGHGGPRVELLDERGAIVIDGGK